MGKFICFYDYKCLICPYYDKCPLSQKKEFEQVIKDRYRGTYWITCRTKNIDKYCASCEKYKQCRIERGLEYKKYNRKNIVLNTFPKASDLELIYYKNGFLHLEEAENIEEVDRKRLLQLNAEGKYEPLNDGFTIQALQRSLRNAYKRSMDTFYGYAKSNKWKYFITLTFSPQVVNRYDDLAVKELYSQFQRWCVRNNPNVKMLMIPERHKDGALHFHGLLADIDLTLILHVDEQGKQQYSKTGEVLFSIKDWKNGISSLAIIPSDNNYHRVANYMQKYVTKAGKEIGYNQKRYYHTRNLTFKNKSIYYFTEQELEEHIEALGIEAVKTTDKFIVFRKRAEAENDK